MDKLSIAFLSSSRRRRFGILSLILWTLVTFQASLVGAFALRLVTGDPTLLPFELRQNLEANSMAFVLHSCCWFSSDGNGLEFHDNYGVN